MPVNDTAPSPTFNEASELFSDIRGFTQMTQQVDLDRVTINIVIKISVVDEGGSDI